MVEKHSVFDYQHIVPTYKIVNNSSNTVNHIELDLQLLPNDSMEIYPKFHAKVITDESSIGIRYTNVRLEQLVPNEGALIIIRSKISEVIKNNSQFLEDAKLIRIGKDSVFIFSFNAKSEYLVYPSIQGKFDKGFGNIKRQPIKDIFNKLEELKFITIER
ncbi:hypothetical protein [Ferruginibacter sp. HRS2-29]|uniref:hypothetical protein n=1 Tax=Ferruginibacter sp. HRS2-29 TaxID=2487334 RepID=UPI0020CC9BCF|nr:hypothetical protein [Ferruginibacter sp. HRS2-29]MCP9752785.1 hypothetical protein [Ferruginibacter sp. HRS2-29]